MDLHTQKILGSKHHVEKNTHRYLKKEYEFSKHLPTPSQHKKDL